MRHLLAICGLVLLSAAAWFIYVGFTMETTVSSDATLPGGMGTIANLQLMHIQLLNVMLGAISALGSCVLFAACAVVVAVQDMRPAA